MNKIELGLVGIIVAMGIFIIITNFAESKELTCLRLYQDIRELSRTPEMQLAEREALLKQKDQVFEYVEKNCPDFQDLEILYDNYKQNFP